MKPSNGIEECSSKYAYIAEIETLVRWKTVQAIVVGQRKPESIQAGPKLIYSWGTALEPLGAPGFSAYGYVPQVQFIISHKRTPVCAADVF